jgi:hypothetical protein
MVDALILKAVTRNVPASSETRLYDIMRNNLRDVDLRKANNVSAEPRRDCTDGKAEAGECERTEAKAGTALAPWPQYSHRRTSPRRR